METDSINTRGEEERMQTLVLLTLSSLAPGAQNENSVVAHGQGD